VQGSIRDVHIRWAVGGGGWNGGESLYIVQNNGRALVKPKNQPGRLVLAT